MSFKSTRGARGERNQNLAENDPNADDIVKYHDRFDYFVEIGENYKLSVELFRDILKYNRSDDEFIVFVMRLNLIPNPVYFFVKPINLYSLGVGFNNGHRFELGRSNLKSRVLGLRSKPLGYTEGYGDLGGLENIRVGYEPLVHAVREIAKGQGKVGVEAVNAWKHIIQGRIGTLSVMLCEGGRFWPLFDEFVRLMITYGTNFRVLPWMPDYINNWEKISDVALNGEVSPNDVRGPPIRGADHHGYANEDAQLALKHKDWALHVIAVNHQPSALPYVPVVKYRNFHCVIVGDIETGKTSFVKTCLTRQFLNNENSTKGVECHLLDFKTTRGVLRIYCWDIENEEKFRDLRDRCYNQCHSAIIMFDLSRKSTYDNVLKWKEDICRVNENIKIVICGSKSDVKGKKAIKSHQVTFPKWSDNSANIDRNLNPCIKPQYFETSAKSKKNLESTFLYLAREFTSDPGLEFSKPNPDGNLTSTITEFDDLPIPLENVVKATKNFADENIIGQGGFSKVHRHVQPSPQPCTAALTSAATTTTATPA